jgi:hypothetical protein
MIAIAALGAVTAGAGIALGRSCADASGCCGQASGGTASAARRVRAWGK